MEYSLSCKKGMVKKLLDPENRTISSLAKEENLPEQTLGNWLNKAKEGTLEVNSQVGNTSRSPREKLSLVIESKTIPEDQYERWLREKGLHSQHITKYEQELRDMAEDKGAKQKKELKELKIENKHLKKDLQKKEKALAELAALYMLKKSGCNLAGPRCAVPQKMNLKK